MLPIGLSDMPGEAMVKLYCPKCQEIYNPKSSRHHHTDGAYFGTGFPHMLFMVHPEYRPKRPTSQFVARLYGFKIHPMAYQLQQQAAQNFNKAPKMIARHWSKEKKTAPQKPTTQQHWGHNYTNKLSGGVKITGLKTTILGSKNLLVLRVSKTKNVFPCETQTTLLKSATRKKILFYCKPCFSRDRKKILKNNKCRNSPTKKRQHPQQIQKKTSK